MSIEELLDCAAEDVRARGLSSAGKHVVPISARGVTVDAPEAAGRQVLAPEALRKLKETGSARHGPHRIVQYENGSILVETDGVVAPITLPLLRSIAREVGVDVLNASGNKKNTRSMGADIIKALS